jgi:hypothetical protein
MAVIPLMEDERQEGAKRKQLLDDLKNGTYFAKSPDIFPMENAFRVKFEEIKGKSKELYRGDHLDTYHQQHMWEFRKALERHLRDGNISEVDISSRPASVAGGSEQSSVTAKNGAGGEAVSEAGGSEQSYDQYYDVGCNWVIYPIMSVEEMKKWAGEKYDVAIFPAKRSTTCLSVLSRGTGEMVSRKAPPKLPKRLSCRESRTTYRFAVHLIS